MKLRQAVSAVVFQNNKFLMVAGNDWPKGAWCFPQGGIKENETHFQAITRELNEELGTNEFKILTKSKIDHTYLFPEKIKQKKKCEGQYQTIWFVNLITKEEIEIEE
jgi:putative (di)nucleoside polyphosphate hydrolase